MHPKIKLRSAVEKAAGGSVRPALIHDGAIQSASAQAASRRRSSISPAGVGAANHARHHVSRQTQS